MFKIQNDMPFTGCLEYLPSAMSSGRMEFNILNLSRLYNNRGFSTSSEFRISNLEFRILLVGIWSLFGTWTLVLGT